MSHVPEMLLMLKQEEKDSEPKPKKRRNNEKKDDVEKVVVIGIEDLPTEMIAKIMSYCDTDDKKTMRCVSKWFFNIVSTASPQLQSLFEAYRIKIFKDDELPKINEVILKAIERYYGPQVKLDLQFEPR